MSLRSDLVDYLTELIPTVPVLVDAKLRVVPSVRQVGEIATPVLIVKTNGLEKLPEAPRSHMRGTFTLILVSPHQDIDRAEDDLEQMLEALLPSLFTWGLSWENAEQTAWDENRLSYDITVNSIYKKE